MLYHISGLRAILFQNDIPLYGYNTFYLSVWAVGSFGFFLLFFFFFFSFSGLHPQYMEAPRLGIESEL